MVKSKKSTKSLHPNPYSLTFHTVSFINIERKEREKINLFLNRENDLFQCHTGWIFVSTSFFSYFFHSVDPFSEYGSGSKYFLNTDPLWIHIHTISNFPGEYPILFSCLSLVCRLFWWADVAAGEQPGPGASSHGHVQWAGHPLLPLQAGKAQGAPRALLEPSQHSQGEL